MRYGAVVLSNVWKDMRKKWMKVLPAGVEQATIDAIDVALDHRGRAVSEVGVYFTCASTLSDSLSQWMHYGHGQGYALRLTVSNNVGLLHNSSGPENGDVLVHGEVSPGWYDVVYKPKLQCEMSETVLWFIARHGHEAWPGGRPAFKAIELLASLSARFKDRAFMHEAEVRYVASPFEGVQERFRVGPRGLIPYVIIRSGNGLVSYPPAEGDRPAPLPITKIRCGPTPPGDRLVVKAAVERLLTANDLAGASVLTWVTR